MDAGESAATRRTVVFYPLRRGILVTDTEFRVTGRRFAVADLAGPGWRRGSAQAAYLAARRIVAVETALVLTAVVLGTVVAGPAPLPLLAGVVDVLLAVAVTQASARHWPARRELWADYRGEPTLLYRSTDHTEFGQVSRALLRAIELNRRLS